MAIQTPAVDRVAALAARLTLTRPLAFFDLESTGKYPERDRIVEIAITKVYPDGRESHFTALVNPTIPIPAEASAIHGITDDQVREMPTFKQLAPTIARGFEGCDLAGYNIRRFDVPLLLAEFRRTPTKFSADGRRLIDPCAVFHKREPRDLSAALQFFCGRAANGAHRTDADVEASIDVLLGQLERYGDLPTSVDELHAYCKDVSWIDDAGRLVWISGVACIGFGKHAGRPLESLAAEKDGRDYLRWILSSDFPTDTKALVQRALDGRFPMAPVMTEST